jgi:hypothetical protein
VNSIAAMKQMGTQGMKMAGIGAYVGGAPGFVTVAA